MTCFYKASCLCGKVTFQVESFDKGANCHCSMCRKFHGAAFGTLVTVQGLKWLSGESLLRHYTAPNNTIRTFCGECGSSLGFRPKGYELKNMEVAVATFDEDIPVVIDAHIYTAYKSNWCELSDGLTKFKEGRE